MPTPAFIYPLFHTLSFLFNLLPLIFLFGFSLFRFVQSILGLFVFS